MTKIDIESPEYLEEFSKTAKFTDKVVSGFDFSYHPDGEIVEAIKMGLTRNKMIYGKRYCPCFMVIGETEEERKAEDNRICPCKPALEKEIPEQGYCHCQIFTTHEYAEQYKIEQNAEEAAHTHSRGLTKEECEVLVKKEQLDGDELESLLEAREIGFVNFTLVDVREWMEWVQNRIPGTDNLIPTTAFYDKLSQIEDKKDEYVILYCFSGSRSAYCQNVLKQTGYKSVANLTYGIMSYRGKTENGE